MWEPKHERGRDRGRAPRPDAGDGRCAGDVVDDDDDDAGGSEDVGRTTTDAAGTTAGRARLSPAAVEAAAGLTAGSAATLVVHPLDIAKTRMQVARDGPAPTTAAVLRSLLGQPRPLAALYRGLGPNLVGNGTSWAAFFFVKARAERLLGAGKDRQGLSPADYFVASAAAGACVQVVTNPVWVLKTRMLASDRGAAGAYPSMRAGAAQLLRTEGVRGFYRGLGVSLLGVSHGAVQFAVYEPLKGWWAAARRDNKTAKTAPAKTAPARTADTLLVSTVAKAVAGAATYPYQVVRSRLQTVDAAATFGRGAAGVVRQLWREAGLRGFYRGLVPSIVRVLPATWVTFLVYENVRHALGDYKH